MELELFLRYFGFISVALFVYVKILNIKKIVKQKIAIAIIFTFILSIVLAHRILFSPIIILISLCLFVSVIIKVEKQFIIPVTTISVGVSIGVYLLSEFIFIFLILIANNLYLFIVTITNHLSQDEAENLRPLILSTIELNPIIYIPYILWGVIVLIITIAFIVLLTRIKRLKNGFIFLESKNSMLAGIIISAIIIILSSIFAGMAFLLRSYTIYEMTELFTSKPVYIIAILSFFIMIALCMVAIQFWWRYQTTEQYKQRIKKRNNEEYLAEMQKKEIQMKALTECNDFLSKAIHRDNKLLPAMYNALANFLSTIDIDSKEAAKKRGETILAELNEMMLERNAIINNNQRNFKSLPTTGIERVDNMLNYMLFRASEKEIQFDFVMVGDIKEIAERTITKQAFETLLADLIENAIIAVSHSEYKKILLTMGIVDDCLEITIQDSGIAFQEETLANLGTKRITTHEDIGGSGIGYMTIFEILNENKGSLIISEQEGSSFTKSIKIRFDG